MEEVMEGMMEESDGEGEGMMEGVMAECEDEGDWRH